MSRYSHWTLVLMTIKQKNLKNEIETNIRRIKEREKQFDQTEESQE